MRRRWIDAFHSATLVALTCLGITTAVIWGVQCLGGACGDAPYFLPAVWAYGKGDLRTGRFCARLGLGSGRIEILIAHRSPWKPSRAQPSHVPIGFSTCSSDPATMLADGRDIRIARDVPQSWSRQLARLTGFSWYRGRSTSYRTSCSTNEAAGAHVSLMMTGLVEAQRQTLKLTLGLWILAILFSGYPVLSLICGPRRRHMRRRKGLCAGCGYSLTGNVSGVCPECGNRVRRQKETSR